MTKQTFTAGTRWRVAENPKWWYDLGAPIAQPGDEVEVVRDGPDRGGDVLVCLPGGSPRRYIAAASLTPIDTQQDDPPQRPLLTAEQLDALPVGAERASLRGNMWKKLDTGKWATRSGAHYPSYYVADCGIPATPDDAATEPAPELPRDADAATPVAPVLAPTPDNRQRCVNCEAIVTKSNWPDCCTRNTVQRDTVRDVPAPSHAGEAEVEAFALAMKGGYSMHGKGLLHNLAAAGLASEAFRAVVAREVEAATTPLRAALDHARWRLFVLAPWLKGTTVVERQDATWAALAHRRAAATEGGAR